MIHHFSQTILNYFVDYIFMAVGYPIIWVADLLAFISNFVFFDLLAALMTIFLGVVFLRSESDFYWKKIKESPDKVIDAAQKHPVFRFWAKFYVNLFVIMLFVMACLKSLSIIAPTEEGMHIMERLSLVGFTAFASFVILSLCAAVIKVLFYTMLGFCKSYGDFKLKMLFK